MGVEGGGGAPGREREVWGVWRAGQARASTGAGQACAAPARLPAVPRPLAILQDHAVTSRVGRACRATHPQSALPAAAQPAETWGSTWDKQPRAAAKSRTNWCGLYSNRMPGPHTGPVNGLLNKKLTVTRQMFLGSNLKPQKVPIHLRTTSQCCIVAGTEKATTRSSLGRARQVWHPQAL